MSFSPATESASTTKRREGAAVSRRIYTTAELATLRSIRSESIRSAVWRNGHFMGIKPIKTGTAKSARLLWPADQVDALFDGGVQA